MPASLRRALVFAAVTVAGAGCEVVYSPTTPSANWTTDESARFILYTRPGSFCASQAASLAQVLEEQYTYATTTFQIATGGRISMFLYPDGRALDPPLGVSSGVAFPETNAVHATCVGPNGPSLWSLLSHEANHVIMQNGLGRAGTSFMNEGLASALIFERQAFMGAGWAHRWVRENRSRVVPVTEMADDSKWRGTNEAYNSSASFLAFLLDRYGAAALQQIYHARSSEIARRVQDVYGTSLAGLEAEWLLTR